MLSFLISLALVSVTVSGQPEPGPVKKGPNASPQVDSPNVSGWSHDYGKSLAMARAAGKPLLLVIEKPGDPSQSHNPETTFGPNGEQDMRQRFVLCRVDASTQYGMQLAQSFNAYQFPFTAISTRDAMHISYRYQGAVTANQLKIALASAAQTHTVRRANVDIDMLTSPWVKPNPAAAPAAPVPANCPNCRFR